MADSSASGRNQAYTAQEIESYLHRVASQRAELAVAIAQARGRLARAVDLEDRIVALEQRIGTLILAKFAAADGSPPAVDPRLAPPGPPQGVAAPDLPPPVDARAE